MNKCNLCGEILPKANNNSVHGTETWMKGMRKYHLFPSRFKKYFGQDELTSIFNIDSFSECGEFCYECHEEILHNIVMNREMVENLSKVFSEKDKKEKICLFHKALGLGLKQLLDI
jgi:hypothetical protein